MRDTVLIVMFDLPSTTRRFRLNASRFRSGLKKLGYLMLQKSIYIKSIPNGSTYRTERKYVRQLAPSSGQVDILPIPLKHFVKISTLTGSPLDLNYFNGPIIEL